MTTKITTDALCASQEAQDKITGLESQRTQLQRDSAVLSMRLAEIIRQSAELKIKFSRGDAAAGVTLEKLDREVLELGHKREGIQLSLSRLEAQLAPLHAEARQLAEAADLERQDREVADFTQTAGRLLDSIIRQWRGACSDAYKLTLMVEEGLTVRNLSGTHKSQILGALATANERLVKASADIVNERWVVASPHRFRSLTIVAANPAGGTARKTG